MCKEILIDVSGHTDKRAEELTWDNEYLLPYSLTPLLPYARALITYI
jgi:hypothetical protein